MIYDMLICLVPDMSLELLHVHLGFICNYRREAKVFVKKPDPHDEAMMILKDQMNAPPTQVDQLTTTCI